VSLSEARRVGRRARSLACTAALGFALVASSAAAQEPEATGATASPSTPTVSAGAAANAAQSAAYLQYMQYLTMMRYSAAGGATPVTPQAYEQWMTNGAAATTVPTSGPGAAYYTNGAEATSYPLAPTAAPVASAPPVPPQPVASASSAPAPAAAPAPSAAPAPAPAPPAASAEPRRAAASPSAGDGVPATPENVVRTTSAVETAPPIAIETALSNADRAGANLEEPRATTLFASDRNGAPSHGVGNLGLLFATLITGMLLGGMAVVRFRARAAPPPAPPAPPPDA